VRAYALLLGGSAPTSLLRLRRDASTLLIGVVLRYLSAVLAARSSDPVMPNLIC
jgi:hypothetical protein